MGVDVDRLRSETRSEHEAVEALLPLMDQELTRKHYTDVLGCLYRIVVSWEKWAAAQAPAGLQAVVLERRRLALLQADLLAMKEDRADLTCSDAPWAAGFPDPKQNPDEFGAAFLGAMYVMEGSTLGGQYISRHLEANLGLAPGVGDAYFRGYGGQTSAMWQTFKALLIEVPDEHAGLVIAAAKAMFRYYAEALRSCPAVHAVASIS